MEDSDLDDDDDLEDSDLDDESDLEDSDLDDDDSDEDDKREEESEEESEDTEETDAQSWVIHIIYLPSLSFLTVETVLIRTSSNEPGQLNWSFLCVARTGWLP